MKNNRKFYALIIGLAFTTITNAGTGLNDNEELNEVELLNTIEFIEDEEESDLGFDVTQYLPYGFDPYKGMVFDISEIRYVEICEPIHLGFDSNEYLPENFNPYIGQ
ncbi:hypothetical protein [Croceitalea rosinachiae]|uniref:Uncharacterized protein n=1 Tax=Croceitalea rosinachiae TaxID=3075596 RepID=A0ABU3A8Y2_9FLAO|nr:hypothetical protein [Croceitalea sp. F388]MDT0606634.1 hypothetical protein [Croceitalea sp. F388]